MRRLPQPLPGVKRPGAPDGDPGSDRTVPASPRAAKPTEALDERWGGGFIGADDFVASIYQSLESR